MIVDVVLRHINHVTSADGMELLIVCKWGPLQWLTDQFAKQKQKQGAF